MKIHDASDRESAKITLANMDDATATDAKTENFTNDDIILYLRKFRDDVKTDTSKVEKKVEHIEKQIDDKLDKIKKDLENKMEEN